MSRIITPSFGAVIAAVTVLLNPSLPLHVSLPLRAQATMSSPRPNLRGFSVAYNRERSLMTRQRSQTESFQFPVFRGLASCHKTFNH